MYIRAAIFHTARRTLATALLLLHSLSVVFRLVECCCTLVVMLLQRRKFATKLLLLLLKLPKYFEADICYSTELLFYFEVRTVALCLTRKPTIVSSSSKKLFYKKCTDLLSIASRMAVQEKYQSTITSYKVQLCLRSHFLARIFDL